MKQLLLEPLANHAAPLFPSQRELARQVAALPDSHYARKERNLAVFLSQVLGGRRPFPMELRQALLQVARDAATRDGWSPTEIAELEERLSETGTGREDEVDLLLARQLRATEVVIVNPYPLEERRHPRSDDFQEAMLRAVIESEANYTFVMDERKDPRHFWGATLEGLDRVLPSSAAASPDERRQELLQRLRAVDDAATLRVMGIPASTCIVPLVAFDPAEAWKCEIYVWDWWTGEDNEVINKVARLSPRVVSKWIDDFYLGLLRSATPPPLRRFVDVSDTLR